VGKGKRSAYLFAFPIMTWAKTKNPDLSWEALKFIQNEGAVELLKTGNIQGTKISHLRKNFIIPGTKPESAKAFVDEVEQYGAPYPMLTNWREFIATINRELDGLWTGKSGAAEVAKAVKEKAEPLSKQGLWQ
jgi:ABC-type glycerol-3-phosphate transport system substrate-binding protein